jgi:hypothetical protein
LTLAKGWAAFGLWESIISGILFVPLLIVLIHFHGAVGAASAWLILNLGYLLIDTPIIHGRMLPGEMKNWLTWSAAVPLLVCFGLFGAIWLVLPAYPPLRTFLWVAVAWALVSLACALAMPHTRRFMARALARLFSR